MQSRCAQRSKLPTPISRNGPETRPTDLPHSLGKSHCCANSRRAVASNSNANQEPREKQRRTNPNVAAREAYRLIGGKRPFPSGTGFPVDAQAAPIAREQQQPPSPRDLLARQEPLRKIPGQETDRNS